MLTNTAERPVCVGPPPFSTVIRLPRVKLSWDDSQAMLTHRDASLQNTRTHSYTLTTAPKLWINTIKGPHPPLSFLSYLAFYP